ncbi:MAG: aspartate aminotransferase family protein [Anaerolineaceae bacterium]|nr:aspartate aminotransferase family protein [Anaerolineaceae bacterium]
MVSTEASIYDRYRESIFPAVTAYYGDEAVVIDRAKDQYVWDVDGRRYLDFFGGVLTISVGHCNDYVTERTIEQLQKVQHTSTLFINPIMVEVAEKVAELAPGRLQKCFFTNSGSEADETAILAARMYTGNRDIVTLRHAYSGRTMLAMTLTAHGTWRLGGVIDPHVKHVRNPYVYRAPLGLSPEQLVDLCVQDLEETIATCTDGRIAAFIAEPIQGVGGFIVPPEDYFKRIEPIVRAAGGIFISDEVQTGWGRTGDKWFGIEHWGIEPDIMTMAKGMANGSPIGCTIATPEVADALKGLTFSTFGGNPVTMATAKATIEYMEMHDLPGNATKQGAALREHLEELQAEFDFIGDVRGMGLMQGVEIIKPGTDKEPDAALTAAVMAAARDQGLLIGKGGLYGNVLRISPHLGIGADDIEVGADLLAKALTQVAQ